jgi:hypothetical protein
MEMPFQMWRATFISMNNNELKKGFGKVRI